MRSTNEIIRELRSELMYQYDWLDYAEATEVAFKYYEEEMLEGLSVEDEFGLWTE